MVDVPMLHKFPDGSANRYYFLFEKMPDGSAVWRDLVFGMEKTELRLQELARGSSNKFFALNLGKPDIRPLNQLKYHDNKRAGG